MKKVWKWGSNILTVIVGLFLAATIYTAVSSRVTGTPSVFGLRIYEVLSGSMEPGIRTGSIILDKQNVNHLAVGDVITFQAPQNEYGNQETVITHRINKIVNQGSQTLFQTKGDANNAPDPELVPAANVISQYDNITIPYLGYYLNFMRSKLSILLFVMLPGALLMIGAMVTLFRELGKQPTDTKADAPQQSVDIPNV